MDWEELGKKSGIKISVPTLDGFKIVITDKEKEAYCQTLLEIIKNSHNKKELKLSEKALAEIRENNRKLIMRIFEEIFGPFCDYLEFNKSEFNTPFSFYYDEISSITTITTERKNIKLSKNGCGVMVIQPTLFFTFQNNSISVKAGLKAKTHCDDYANLLKKLIQLSSFYSWITITEEENGKYQIDLEYFNKFKEGIEIFHKFSGVYDTDHIDKIMEAIRRLILISNTQDPENPNKIINFLR